MLINSNAMLTVKNIAKNKRFSLTGITFQKPEPYFILIGLWYRFLIIVLLQKEFPAWLTSICFRACS